MELESLSESSDESSEETEISVSEDKLVISDDQRRLQQWAELVGAVIVRRNSVASKLMISISCLELQLGMALSTFRHRMNVAG